MSLHACWRSSTTDRQLCRYEDRMTDAQCSGCTLRKPDPPKARRAGWLDRSRQFANEGKPKWDI